MNTFYKWSLDMLAIVVGVFLAEVALNHFYGNRGEHSDGGRGSF